MDKLWPTELGEKKKKDNLRFSLHNVPLSEYASGGVTAYFGGPEGHKHVSP